MPDAAAGARAHASSFRHPTQKLRAHFSPKAARSRRLLSIVGSAAISLNRGVSIRGAYVMAMPLLLPAGVILLGFRSFALCVGVAPLTPLVHDLWWLVERPSPFHTHPDSRTAGAPAAFFTAGASAHAASVLQPSCERSEGAAWFPSNNK